MDSLSFIRREGPEIATVFDDLASLRMKVFRDFPYLYEGSVEYEKHYLAGYGQSKRSFLFGVYSGEKMVGATTCMPLRDETAEIRKPFEEAGLAVDSFFYFGESILLPEFRGQGLGHRFFDEREAHARSFGTYEKACFLSVERPPAHPAKPINYRPNDTFWEKRGYRRRPAIRAILEWPDIDEEEASPKSLVCWMKDL